MICREPDADSVKQMAIPRKRLIVSMSERTMYILKRTIGKHHDDSKICTRSCCCGRDSGLIAPIL